MRFDAAARRLEALPDPLPPAGDALMPTVVGGRSGDRRWPTDRTAARRAAVLVLVHPDADGEARLVLIERTTHDGHHAGEVSFPGGKAEPEDADDAATALREATEEVGLDPVGAGVRVTGVLDRIWIPVSDFEVTPIVAVAARAPVLSPDPREVARIVQPTVDGFVPDAPLDIVERVIDAWTVRYGQYLVDDLAVWGATARILSQLGAVLTTA